MTAAALELRTVSVDDREQWSTITAQITRRTGKPPTVELDDVRNLVAVCAPVLLTAARAQDVDSLRGRFSDRALQEALRAPEVPVAQVTGITVHMLGVLPGSPGTAPRFRMHLQFGTQTDQNSQTLRQFWDVEVSDAPAQHAPALCGNCGAPIPEGAVHCRYCHADLRSGPLPLTVCEIKLY